MFLLTGINALINLALDLAIQEEEERKAAKAATQAAMAGLAGAMGDVGASVAIGAHSAAEIGKLASEDAGVLEAIDTVAKAVGGGAGGFAHGLEPGLVHLGARAGAGATRAPPAYGGS